MFVVSHDPTSRYRPKLLFRPLSLQDLPADILPPILAQLSDRADWHSCALVSKVFNRVATPLLYRTLDSRIISKSVVHHPSATLLKRPEYAQYVRRVTETGAVHRCTLPRYSNITKDTLEALALCKNLESITWIDDSSITDSTLLSFIAVIRKHPLQEINIRTHSDLGTAVWAEIHNHVGLRKISIWCMEGPPRVLQGWSASLGDTLTHLELGVSAYSYPCSDLLSQLPKLKDLRLKGAPATMIPTIMAYLLDLRSLDTEYPGSYSSRRHGDEDIHRPAFPSLRELTVRTSSIDSFGPLKLWGWIRALVPKPGLETLKLHAFTINSGHTSIPRMFILDLAVVHGETLKHFMVGETQLTLRDIECLCTKFPKLETLVCSTASPDIQSITDSISVAKNLQTLRLHVQWIPNDLSIATDWSTVPDFTMQHATNLMLRTDDSKLRTIAIGSTLYTGKWVLEEPGKENVESKLTFQVMGEVAEDRWQT
ncbi:hypothetical protein DXG03_004048 [Asterophora parasitica]|uniref:F-box domain-containing protein n=1 Tax=Asterophora parasitica TaxID=117018 RepID=A0A9P7GFJ4_9AGAR|nr:hypothetical protein DXG03_004048 [Asterophora parasitica]